MAFMTARLQRRWGPVVASLIVAPCFGFLHFPLFFVTGGLIDNARPQGGQVLEYAFYLLILFSVPVRILITWVVKLDRRQPVRGRAAPRLDRHHSLGRRAAGFLSWS